MCIGPLTGGGFNPARAFGPMLVCGVLEDEFGQWLVVYTLGPIIGALIAVLLVRYFYPDELEEAEASRPRARTSCDDPGRGHLARRRAPSATCGRHRSGVGAAPVHAAAHP